VGANLTLQAGFVRLS